jgi:hypothetical protein
MSTPADDYVLRFKDGREPLYFSSSADGSLRVAAHAAHAFKILRLTPDGRCLVLSGTRVLQGVVKCDGAQLRIDTPHGCIEGTEF